MLSVSECRKILGKKYESCTDKEIEQIREWVYLIADVKVKGLAKNQNLELKNSTQSEYKNAS